MSGDGPSAASRIRLDEFLCGVGKGNLAEEEFSLLLRLAANLDELE